MDGFAVGGPPCFVGGEQDIPVGSHEQSAHEQHTEVCARDRLTQSLFRNALMYQVG